MQTNEEIRIDNHTDYTLWLNVLCMLFSLLKMSIVANGTHSLRSAGKSSINEMSSVDAPPMEQLNWLIHLLHVRGQTASCKELINAEIVSSRSLNEFACFKQAVILREEGKLQESLEAFQLCHRLNPENVDNFKEIGKCLFTLRRYRLALEAYLEAEKVSNKPDWEIYHNLGECYVRLNDMARAKEYVHKAVQLGRQEISYSLLIKILTSEGDLRAAVAICNAAVESCPDSVAMLTKSGILYLKVGEAQQAFERLSSALALEPSNPKALLGVGCITQNHDEYDVALSKYKIAVQTDADSVALWNNIGMCFYSKQKYIAAITCLKRALWLSPLNWKVLLNLGLVNMATNQAASSFNFLCASVNIRSDIGFPFMILGCALLELKDGENALRALRQAITLNKAEPSIVINTALCFLISGNLEAASDHLQIYKNLPDTQKTNEMNALYTKLVAALASQSGVENSTDADAPAESAVAAIPLDQDEDEV